MNQGSAVALAPAQTIDSASVGRKKEGQRVGLILLLILSFGWRLSGLTKQSLWRDEVDVLYMALRPLSKTLEMFTSPAQNGPLYFLSIRPWILATGSSEFALRLVSALAGTLAIVLLWQVARRLLPGDGRLDMGNLPLMAAIFLALNPYQVWYSQEGKMYAIIMCLSLISTWSWLDAVRIGGGRRWVLYLITTTLCIYTHLLTVLILPLHALWFLISWPRSKDRWKAYLLTTSGFVLPYLPLIWWQWHYLNLEGYETGYPFVPLAEVVRSLLLGYTQGAQIHSSELWLIPIFFALLAGAALGVTEMRRRPIKKAPLSDADASPLLLIGPGRRLALLISWLVVPVLLIYGMSLVQPIFVDRYVIWISSAFVMLLALGIQTIRRSNGVWSAGLAALLVLYIWGFWLWTGYRQVEMPNKTQLREAVAYVEERRDADDLLILQIPHTEFAYRYYTSDFGSDPFAQSEQRLAPWAKGLWTRNGLDDEAARREVDQIMRNQTAGFEEAWVILVEAGSWDPRRLMDEWLAAEAELLSTKQFHGIQAQHFRLP